MARRDQYIFAKKKQSEYLKETLIIIILMILIVLIALFLFFNLFGKSAKIVVADNPVAEMGSKAKASDYIKEIKKGVLKADQDIDTTRLGTTKVEVVVDQNGNEKTYNFDVEVVDTTPPVIEGAENFSVIKGGSVDLASQAQVSDNSGEKIAVETSGNLDLNKEGTYSVTLNAADPSGNATTKEVTVTVIDPTNAEGDFTFTSRTGIEVKRESGVTMAGDTVIVNKSFPLPEEYGPWTLTEETLEAYYELINGALNEKGLNLFAIDTFVSHANQGYSYDNYVWSYGYDKAEENVARAGHSEHQTGLAIDINWTDTQFGDTEEGRWLSDNCWKYGFIIRYPKGKTDETGFAYQPWHIRYVGKDLAEKLYNDGDWITMESYFGLPSEYAEDNSEKYK